MLKFVVVSALVVCVAAGGYGGSSSGGYSAPSQSSSSGGYSAPSQSSNAGGYGGASGYAGQVVPAAVQTRHTVEFRDVPSSGNVNPTTVEVGANSVPLNILFRSSSSSLNVQQAHDGAQGSTQETSSEDEPHRLVHSVTKPIIQEVREIITPFRRITQEIQPVQEEVLTIVARGNEQPSQQAAAPSLGQQLSQPSSQPLSQNLAPVQSKPASSANLGRTLSSPSSGSSFGSSGNRPSFSSLGGTKSRY